MPVLKIYFDRFERMTHLSREKILDRLPYLGLDIEGVDSDAVRVEYNPNRADFSTDYGIARALRGLIGAETGLPAYRIGRGRISVEVDENLAEVRPFIACAVARRIELDDETIRQLISMQEDLHNGIARKRRKAAIGLHDLDAIVPPLTYRGVDASFEFTPLGSTARMSIAQILRETETGVSYGAILKGSDVYPVLADSAGTVLSFPPIINGDRTKVGTRTRNLFIDVTSTVERIGDDALAIICAALADAGAGLESVRIEYAGRKKSPSSRSRRHNTPTSRPSSPSRPARRIGTPRITPDMEPEKMRFDADLAVRMTGLSLAPSEMRRCLRRSRLDLDRHGYALIPRYRVDILHPVDLTEEVAIGYGLDRIEPLYPASSNPGGYDHLNVALDRISETMSRAGFIEAMNYDLVDRSSLYDMFSRSPDAGGVVEVENPRTSEHHILRDAIIPSLMSVLSRNVNAVYPQKVFEVGRVYLGEEGGQRVREAHHLAALIADSSSSFSGAKMYLEALVREHSGEGRMGSRASAHWAFAEGRCAEASLDGRAIGYIGEVKPSVLAAFGLDVPVSGFEIDLSALT